jgi:heat shock protein HslJ
MSQMENPSDLQSPNEKRSLPVPVIGTIAIVLGIAILLAILSILGILDGRTVNPEDTAPFVQILQPASGAEFPISEAVTISGIASGLYEGSLVVQVLDAQKKVLVETPASIKIERDRAGVAGSWSVQVIVMTDPGTQGSVRAFAPSLSADRIVAEEVVPVNFTFQAAETYIEMIDPLDGSVLDTNNPVVVSGMAGGLFEGAMVVEALDESGNSLAFQPTIIDSPNAGIGGEGPWRVELPITAFPGTRGYLRAYTTSPKDGSITAEDSVQVTYGDESLALPAYIEILEPEDGATLDISQPVAISGMGRGLFEGNVVVQVIDQSGNVLVQQPTIIQSGEAGMGGEGPWSLSLVIESAPGIPGMIRAYSDSPADGSILAEDSVLVIYGHEAPSGSKLPIESTAWQLISVANEPVLEESLVWIEFDEGSVRGSAGCNDYFSSYRADEGTLNMDTVATTRKMCPEPEGIMEQEGAYIMLLENIVTYAIEGSQLFLAEASGEISLVYQSALVGTLNAAAGYQIPQDATVTISLEESSQADAPPVTVSEMEMTGVAGFPLPFALPYDLRLIDTNKSYAIRVRIETADSALLYTNAQAYPVLTRGNPRVVEVAVGAVE